MRMVRMVSTIAFVAVAVVAPPCFAAAAWYMRLRRASRGKKVAQHTMPEAAAQAIRSRRESDEVLLLLLLLLEFARDRFSPSYVVT